MSVKEKYFLELECNCVACQTSEFGPTLYAAKGDTLAECYTAAMRAGWRIFRAANGEQMALCPHCLVSDKNKRKWNLEYGNTEG